MSWKPWMVASLGVALVAACSDTIVEPPANGAELRLLHASAGFGNLELEVGGTTVIRDVPYGRSSPLVIVPSGSQRLVVRAGGTVVGTIDGNLAATHVNSVIVAGGVPQLASQVDPDTGTVAPARANIRFVVHGTDNTAAPTQLHALLSGTTLPVDSTMRFGIDATVSRYWSLMYFNPGRFTVKFVPQGATTPVLTEATFDVATGEAKALVLRREAGGAYKVEVVVEP